MNKSKYNWKEIQKEYDNSGHGYGHLKQIFGVSVGAISNAIKRGEFIPRTKNEAQSRARANNPNIGKMTNETRKKISKSMKKFMIDNPEKCPYLQNHYSKGLSYPEKYFKKCFNGKFQERFRILNYQLDFADIENKIDIEIDGEQHFVDPRIKESDERRNNALTKLGWSIIRVRWSLFQRLDKEKKEHVVRSIINNVDCGYDCCLFIKSNPDIDKIKKFYETYNVKKVKTKIKDEYIYKKYSKTKKCPDCGILISYSAKHCVKCYIENHKYRKVERVNRPSKDELQKLVYSHTMTKLGEMYNVSDNAVRKWCKKQNVQLPPQGYWLKKDRSGGSTGT